MKVKMLFFLVLLMLTTQIPAQLSITYIDSNGMCHTEDLTDEDGNANPPMSWSQDSITVTKIKNETSLAMAVDAYCYTVNPNVFTQIASVGLQPDSMMCFDIPVPLDCPIPAQLAIVVNGVVVRY